MKDLLNEFEDDTVKEIILLVDEIIKNEMTFDPYLKSCPSCGHSAELEMDANYWHVTCNGCGLQTDGTDEPEGAVDLWNTRVETGKLDQVADFLREIVAIIEAEPEFPDANYGPARGWAETAPIDVARAASRMTKDAILKKLREKMSF